jgi:S-formylglutathione hydrolase FrmB
VDSRKVVFNAPPAGVSERRPALRVNVLEPPDFDPARTYPVLYLLHGRSDAYDHWAHPAAGAVVEVLGDLDAFVVMPEAARGWYADWWNGGRRGDPAWQRHHLDELLPLVEKRLPLRPGRRWRAIAGLSMGGLGAVHYAAARPGYFGAAASFSGALSIRRPDWPERFDTPTESHTTVYGHPDEQSFYWAGHDPAALLENLRTTRLFVTAGDGTAAAGDVETDPANPAVERVVRTHSQDYVAAAGRVGVELTWEPTGGSHEWPTWRRALQAALRWGVFEPVPDEPDEWTYETVASSGAMWGLRFTFEEPPGRVQRFERRGSVLRGIGAGAVTLARAGAVERREVLPFEIAI